MTNTQCKLLLISIYTDDYINHIIQATFSKNAELASLLEYYTDRNIQAIKDYLGPLNLAAYVRFEEDYEEWKRIFKDVSAVYKDMVRTYHLEHPVFAEVPASVSTHS